MPGNKGLRKRVVTWPVTKAERANFGKVLRKYKGLAQSGLPRNLKVRDTATGEFRLLTPEEAAKYTDRRLSELKNVRKLEYGATLDPATRLRNQAFFMDELHRLKAKADLGREAPFAVINLDLDFFKDYNTAYGHDAGTKALIRFSKRFKRVLRQNAGDDGMLARTGGEEFTAIIRGKQPLKRALKTLKQLKLNLKERPMRHTGSPHKRLTFSAGVAVYRPGEGDKPYKAADRALEEAKQFKVKSKKKSGTFIPYKNSIYVRRLRLGGEHVSYRLKGPAFNGGGRRAHQKKPIA